MRVRFLNLSVKKKDINKHLLNIKKILISGYMVPGKEVEVFERKIAKYCNRKYALGVNSGTDALFLAVRSLGLSKNDEIITTPLSWISSSNAIVMSGIKVRFADIKDDLNICHESIKKLINKKTKAVLVVNYTGKCCDYEKISKICKSNKIYLIEDASQSFGVNYKGRKSGSFGDISAISHNPMKVFSAFGEAGTVTTNNKSLYEKMKILRYGGMINKEYCVQPSLNSKMDTIQASILLLKINDLKKTIIKRRKNAELYFKYLKNICDLPKLKNLNESIFYTFTILVKKRDRLKKFLAEKKIETKIQHPILIPEQKGYKKLINTKDKYPNAIKLKKQILSLPIHENISKKEIIYVCNNIRKFFKV